MKLRKHSDLVAAVILFIKYKGSTAWEEKVGEFKIGNRYVRCGFPGSSDVHGIGPEGRALFIECKVAPAKLNANQQAFLADAVARGAFAVCVYSVDQLEKHWQVEFGA